MDFNDKIIEINTVDDYTKIINTSNNENHVVVVITNKKKFELLDELRKNSLTNKLEDADTICLIPPNLHFDFEQSLGLNLPSEFPELIQLNSLDFEEPIKEKSFREITRKFLTRKKY